MISKRYSQLASACIGSEYTQEELEFFRAMEAYKTKHNRRFPTLHEVLGVLKSLGYRKCAEAAEPMKPSGALG